MSRPIMRTLSTLVLASVMAATPACSSFPLGETWIENPIAAARTTDQRAYALLQTYAVMIEQAADIVRDPRTPVAVRRGLADAERVATPAAETLGVAMRAYIAARADINAAPQSRSASTAFTIAASRLAEAVAAAQAPISQLAALVSARRN